MVGMALMCLSFEGDGIHEDKPPFALQNIGTSEAKLGNVGITIMNHPPNHHR